MGVSGIQSKQIHIFSLLLTNLNKTLSPQKHLKYDLLTKLENQ